MISKNKMIIAFIMAGILASIITFTPVTAADWPMFHQNTDHTGFLIQPGDFSPTLWNFNTGDSIQSSPAIKDK
ncbi:MAG: PQQ-binding-like beta-propeller repeat protein, partial [Methanothermobacter sp.]